MFGIIRLAFFGSTARTEMFVKFGENYENGRQMERLKKLAFVMLLGNKS